MSQVDASKPDQVWEAVFLAGFGLCFAIMYRLYIDETGNPDLGSSDDPNHRYLSLTGVIIERDHVRNILTPRLNALKQEFFDPDPDEPIVLHRKDIMKRNWPFHTLRNPALAAEFDRRLLSLLQDCEYVVITAVIDKLEHRRRYVVWRYNPYHYCLEVLLERYALWLNRRRVTGDVMAEVRGRWFDLRLEKAFSRHYKHGTAFVRRDVMQRCLTSKNLKLKTKEKNISGLQVADILAHPSSLNIRSCHAGDVTPRGFGQEIVSLLNDSKYNRSPQGNIDGWGTKWLP